jgi:prepilin-type N-terminal cleavage/methylation domain-containing protein
MRRGFTLVELLVVVAILGLLLSILLPSYLAMVERADRCTCQNNHHQLVTACMAYTTDWRQYLPFCNSRSAEVSGWPGPGWLYDYADTGQHSHYEPRHRERGVLWPYLRNHDFYRCPLEEPPYPGCNNITSYLMNRSVVAGSGLPSFRCWRTTDIIAFVGGEAILLWEAADADWNDGCSYPWQDLTRRHGEGATVGCVGGQTDWISHEAYEAQQDKRPGRLYCNPISPQGY